MYVYAALSMWASKEKTLLSEKLCIRLGYLTESGITSYHHQMSALINNLGLFEDFMKLNKISSGWNIISILEYVSLPVYSKKSITHREISQLQNFDDGETSLVSNKDLAVVWFLFGVLILLVLGIFIGEVLYSLRYHFKRYEH